MGRIASQTERNFTEVIALAEEKTEILQRIAVKSGSKIEIIAIGDIVYLESEGDYVMIHTKEGKFLKEKTMKYFGSISTPIRLSEYTARTSTSTK